MVRLARNAFDGGTYHIFQRGNNKQVIFRSKEDYLFYLKLIKQYLLKYKFELYHYCLMPNHIHLLLKIIIGNELPKLMQCLQQGYSRWYKNCYGYYGHLWQGRYKSFLIETDEYLLECARYIERNPLRKKLVEHLSDYPWSSYKVYAEGKTNDFITKNILYITLGKTERERQIEYKKYLLPNRPYENLIDLQFDNIN